MANLIPDMIPDFDDDPGCWGFDDSCDNLREEGEELCASCQAKRVAYDPDADPAETPGGFAPDGLGDR